MKRIAATALAVCLLGGTVALAQPQNQTTGGQHNGGKNSGVPKNGGQPHNNPQVYQHTVPAAPQNVPHYNPQVYQHNVPVAPQNVPHNNPQVYQHTVPAAPQNVPHYNPQVYQHNVPVAPQANNFNPRFGAPGYRPGGQRPQYNPQYFPRTFNMGVRYHWRGRSWSGPQGWYYRPWYYGQILPYAWLGSNWWINDYWDYDLPVPPYGYEWIRNGPDALLVDINTGEVVEVIPGIFY